MPSHEGIATCTAEFAEAVVDAAITSSVDWLKAKQLYVIVLIIAIVGGI